MGKDNKNIFDEFELKTDEKTAINDLDTVMKKAFEDNNNEVENEEVNIEKRRSINNRITKDKRTRTGYRILRSVQEDVIEAARLEGISANMFVERCLKKSTEKVLKK